MINGRKALSLVHTDRYVYVQYMVVLADSSGPGRFFITNVATGANGDLINVTLVQVSHTIL